MLKKDLQEEYEKTLQEIEKKKKLLKIIEDKFTLYAKYKVGQKVAITTRWDKIKKIGIIRKIVSEKRYNSDKLEIFYFIGKITKSGKIHKSSNIWYEGILEKEITRAIE